MKLKLLSVAFAASFAFAAFTGTALADKGGTPNARACHGQLTKLVVQSFGGSSQKVFANTFGLTVGGFHKALKEICTTGG